MAGILEFENGDFWKIKGFYFCRYIDAVIARHREDIELVEELRMDSSFGLINVARLRNEKGSSFVARLLGALISTANAILEEGSGDIAELGKERGDVYHQTIQDLLAKLNAQNA
jgi:hypothetical protein